MNGDTYEGREAWLRTVKNARRAGCLDDPKAVGHVKATTLSEVSAMREQKRLINRASFSMPDCSHIFNKGA